MERANLAVVIAAAALAACNDATLTAIPVPEPCSATSSAEIAPSIDSLAIRSAGLVYRTPAISAASAAPSPDAMLESLGIDLDFVTSRMYVGDPRQSGVFPDLGTIEPTQGSSFLWLSTGVAGAGTSRTQDPEAYGTQQGTDFFRTCGDGLQDHDCVELQFSFVVPEDMHSVKFDFRFMSSEFPEYVASGYNDEFTVRMLSPSYSFTNIVFDADGSLVNIDSAFFDEPCSALGGTGFDLMGASGCDAGGTGLLHTTAPVVPGETVSLSFRLLDRGDGIYDSAVAIDNLQVSANEVGEPETNPCD